MADRGPANRILTGLAPAVLNLLLPFLEAVPLAHRQRLETPNRPIEHVYFVDDGIVTVVATGPRRLIIEVGVIGMEGCTGLSHILGAGRSPLDTHVQVSGAAHRILVADLSDIMRKSARLRDQLSRAAHVFSIQVAYTALANGHATLEQRLARWLLMAQDRLKSPQVRLTHEFLAIMLGVRRPGVTVALARLQELGLVDLGRGAINIRDRSGLMRLADRYYGTPEAEFERLFGA